MAATTAAVDEAMAGYAFGEVTRILYDAIWSEFCDWGLELAKVRLADESLPAEERETTWWTLVDALDAYLRLLHPVMPFVTEALWPAIPHRAADPELLIVARWPAAGERDLGVEAASTRCSTRSPRSATRGPLPVSTPPAGWRPTSPRAAMGVTSSRRSPRPSSAWPAPVHSSWTNEREDLPRPSGSLEIVLKGGDIQATVLTTASGDAAALERTRLEKELAEAEGWLAAARARLANDAFVGKAPQAVVEGARERERELAEQVDRLRERLAG